MSEKSRESNEYVIFKIWPDEPKIQNMIQTNKKKTLKLKTKKKNHTQQMHLDKGPNLVDAFDNTKELKTNLFMILTNPPFSIEPLLPY